VKRILPVLLLASGLFASSAMAVVDYGNSGTANNTSTGAGAGWDYTGTVLFSTGSFNASGVYLGSYGGSYWVLTADHITGTLPVYGVGLGSFNLGSFNYAFSGSAIRITSGDLGNADLVVVRISSTDSAATSYLSTLPNLSLATTSNVGSTVKMIGNGLDRAPSLTTYFVDTGTTPFVWSTTSFPEADATVNGYAETSTNVKRWGTNTADSTSTADAGFGNTHVVITDFDAVDGQAQVALGDSGGGVFLGNSSTLTGILLYDLTFSGQPGNTAVVGNQTAYADISTYRSNILSVIPEPGSFGLLVLGGLATGAVLYHRRKLLRKSGHA